MCVAREETSCYLQMGPIHRLVRIPREHIPLDLGLFRGPSTCLFPRPLDQLLNLVSPKSQLNRWPQPISSICRIIYRHTPQYNQYTPQYNYEHGLISIHWLCGSRFLSISKRCHHNVLPRGKRSLYHWSLDVSESAECCKLPLSRRCVHLMQNYLWSASVVSTSVSQSQGICMTKRAIYQRWGPRAWDILYLPLPFDDGVILEKS